MAKKTKQTKLKVKVGDFVKVIAGDDKGITGEVLSVNPTKNLVTIEGVNTKYKHQKPTENQEGGIVEIVHPIHISNVLHVSSAGETFKVGRKVEDGRLVRYNKKSGEIID